MSLKLVKFTLMTILLCVATLYGTEIPFAEKFALADNRSAVLDELIPGTEDFYHYQTLLAQHEERFADAQQWLDQWIKRYNATNRYREMLNRQQLLTFKVSPAETYRHLIRELSLHFNHSRRVPERVTTFPEKLSPNDVSLEQRISDGLNRWRRKSLQEFRDPGLYHLYNRKLTADQRRDLLRRLSTPDFPELAALVVADLNYEHSGGFGSLEIHKKMTRSQLEECLQQLPRLRSESTFIETYMARLVPNADEDPLFDEKVKEAYLQRLWGFAATLPPAFNSIKVHVLYHMLDLSRQRGEYDRDLFLQYIKLPRPVPYIPREFTSSPAFRLNPANLNQSYPEFSSFHAVGNDTELVKDFLAHFFLNADDHMLFSEWIRDDFLKEVFLETKILNGLGDTEQWYSMMSPDAYQRLRDRVDIIFAPGNPEIVQPGQPLELDLLVKNAPEMIIRVFEINLVNYYREELEELDTAVNLDGLTAGDEETVVFNQPPLRRIKHRISLPVAKEPGAYVIEAIGGGRSSRAVVRVGRLHAVEEITEAGHMFRIYDHNRQPQTAARAWLGNSSFNSDQHGNIFIPFSSNPGSRKLVFETGRLALLTAFDHIAENYQLDAGIHLDREQLRRGGEALMLIRPQLSVASRPLDASLIKKANVAIVCIDRFGTETAINRENLSFANTNIHSITFQVPDNLQRVTVGFSANVERISESGKETALHAARTFTVNTIDNTPATADLHLTRADDDWIIELRGKNGERIASQAIAVTLHSPLFNDYSTHNIQSDNKGRINLGPLPIYDRISARAPDGNYRTWNIQPEHVDLPTVIHAAGGTTIRIPWTGNPQQPLHTQAGLLEIRRNNFVTDRLDTVQARDNHLEISNLPGGDYRLLLRPQNKSITIRIGAGNNVDDLIWSESRILQQQSSPRPVFGKAASTRKEMKATVLNHSSGTRVFAAATQYQPAFPLYQTLNLPPPAPPVWQPASPIPTLYVSGRKLGEEYRYILDRRNTVRLPGNMLERPSLLMFPWSPRKTTTGRRDAAAGEDYLSEAPATSRMERYAGGSGGGISQFNDPASLDFLASGSKIFADLVPDANGSISLPLEKLKGCNILHLWLQDGNHTAAQTVALPEIPIKDRDIRLAEALSKKSAFIENKEISFLKSGTSITIENPASARWQIYSTLDQVFPLLQTLAGDDEMAQFRFLTRWNKLDRTERLEKYSRFACHEINLFLYYKDRPFFDEVIRPVLQNKPDPDFIDRWLLKLDLSEYLAPWRFSRLNALEKALLARRMPRQQASIKDWLHNTAEMNPLPPEEFDRRFETALMGRALSTPQAPQLMRSPALRGGIAAGNVYAFADKSAGRVEELSAMALAPQPAEAMEMEADAVHFGSMPSRQRKSAALEARRDQRALYRQADQTREWIETYYHRVAREDAGAELIPVSSFWIEVAGAADLDSSQINVELIHAANNLNEALAALAFIDLPFDAEPPRLENTQDGLRCSVASPAVVVHRQIKQAKDSAREQVLVAQNYYKLDERYTEQDGVRQDKFIGADVEQRVAYGCQTVLTNPTSTRRQLKLLLQIPQGALPLQNGFYTRSIPVTLEPFATFRHDFAFYFPAAGVYPHYPVQVYDADVHLGAANGREFTVHEQLARQDTESWDYISQNGETQQVFEFLRNKNLNRVELDWIAWRMRDAAFFKQALNILSERNIYNPTLWSYALKHQDNATTKEFLENSALTDRCGLYLQSTLLEIDAVERLKYAHREYRPLINARRHRLGAEYRILNDRFFEQYNAFVTALCYKPQLDPADRIQTAYYLFLQDRVQAALQAFDKLPATAPGENILYDYMKVYVLFYRGQPQQAAEIAALYQEHPIKHWRNMFADAVNQAQELLTGETAVADAENRRQQLTALAASEGNVEISVSEQTIAIQHQNLTNCVLNFYPIDVELLFSQNPFVQEDTERFSYIQPYLTQTVELPAERGTVEHPIPAELANSNFIIEAVTPTTRKAQACYSHRLAVQLIEAYGHLQVTHADTAKAMPGVYIKVYARLNNGQVKFYKDGYTDLRGRFDYAELSTDTLDSVQRFALLIISPDDGAVVRETAPPVR